MSYDIHTVGCRPGFELLVQWFLPRYSPLLFFMAHELLTNV